MNQLDVNGYPAVGDLVEGRYRIEHTLGEGGMGVVARATHVLRKAPVALKFMSPRFISFPDAVERFVNEAVAASQIHSDHVVQIYDVGKLPNGAPFLVMECLEGVDLAYILRRDGAPGLQTERALHFVVQILRGLEVAHGAGIVHRDIKPSNVFVVRREGQEDFVKLLDFGISKVHTPGQAALTQANAALGTPLYMSPEQAQSPRDVDFRTDIYSAGVILFELLTGTPPFTSESGELTELILKLFSADLPRIQGFRPDIPDGLAAAVERMLARDRDRRYQNVMEAAEGLAPYTGPMTQSVLNRIRQDVPARLSANAPPMSSMPPLPSFSSPPLPVFTMPPSSAPAIQHSMRPPSVDARVTSPEELEAATQYSSAQTTPPKAPPPAPPPPASAARTDLGAVTDTRPPAVPERRRTVVIGVMASMALLGGIGATIAFRSWMVPAPSPAASSERPEPLQPPVPQPPPPSTVVVAPSAPPTAPTPSASASSSATPDAPDAGPSRHPPLRPPTTPHSPGNPLNIKPID